MDAGCVATKGGIWTVMSAELLVTLPQGPVAVQEYVPALEVVRVPKVRVEAVAPSMGTPPLDHW